MAESKGRRLFELDRKMELKLRLAARRAEEGAPRESGRPGELPPREVVDRLIDRVRRL